MDRIFEAFTPSGDGSSDFRQGLFIGPPALIKDWVAETHDYCQAKDVRLVERRVTVLTDLTLAELRKAKKMVTDANRVLKQVLQR